MKKLKDLVAKQLKKHDVDVDETIDTSDKCPVFLVAAGSAVFTLWRSYVKIDEDNDIVTSELYTPYETTGINGNEIEKFVKQLNAAIRLGRFETPMEDDPFLRYAVAVSGDDVRTNPEDAVLKLISAPAALLDLTTPAFTMLLVGRYTVNEAVADATSAVKAINADGRYGKRLLGTATKIASPHCTPSANNVSYAQTRTKAQRLRTAVAKERIKDMATKKVAKKAPAKKAVKKVAAKKPTAKKCCCKKAAAKKAPAKKAAAKKPAKKAKK